MKVFPNTRVNIPTSDDLGMDLRDYFAAQAMQGLLAANPDVDVEDVIEALAIAAYEMANAMMEARK